MGAGLHARNRAMLCPAFAPHPHLRAATSRLSPGAPSCSGCAAPGPAAAAAANFCSSASTSLTVAGASRDVGTKPAQRTRKATQNGDQERRSGSPCVAAEVAPLMTLPCTAAPPSAGMRAGLRGGGAAAAGAAGGRACTRPSTNSRDSLSVCAPESRSLRTSTPAALTCHTVSSSTRRSNKASAPYAAFAARRCSALRCMGGSGRCGRLGADSTAAASSCSACACAAAAGAGCAG